MLANVGTPSRADVPAVAATPPLDLPPPDMKIVSLSHITCL